LSYAFLTAPPRCGFVLLESGCKSRTFYHTIQIIPQEKTYFFSTKSTNALTCGGLGDEKKHVLERKIFVKSQAFGKKQYFHNFYHKSDFPSNEVKT